MNSCVCLIFVSLWTFCTCEPECSRFHYEEKTLEKIVKTEFIVDKLNSELRERDGTTKAELEKIRDDLEKINSDIIAVKERQEVTSTDDIGILEKLKDKEGSQLVAFRASNMKNKHANVGDTIIFTSTTFNRGGGYDNTTGIYTAPTGGVYIFTCQFCVMPNHYVKIDLVQGSTKVNTMFTDGGKMNGACREMVDVLLLDKNEEVRIDVSKKVSGTVFWQNSSGKNIFAGVLISVV